MGCVQTKPMGPDWKRDIRIKHRAVQQIYSTVMTYNFYSTSDEIQEKPQFTFQMRLWRDLTNAFGDSLDADSMKRILFQLKRFLYLSATYLTDIRSVIGMRVSTINTTRQSGRQKEVFFKRIECPLVAPPMVDLAWRLFLTYTPQYTYLASKLGVYIERNHEKQVTDFEAYQETIREYRRLYRGSQNLDFAIWVLYKDEKAFRAAFNDTCFLCNRQRQLLVEEAKKVEEITTKDEAIINVDERVKTVKQKLVEVRTELMELNNKQGGLKDLSARAAAEEMFKENCKHYLLKRMDTASPETKNLKQVLDFVRFDEFSQQSLASEMCFTIEQVRQVVIEYVKFIYLMQFSKAPLTPSDQVDQVWHFHMTHGKSYHAMGKEIFGKFVHHGPTQGGDKESKKFKEWYNYTLYLYEKILGEKPSPRYWPCADRRFSQDYSQQAWIDVRKLLAILNKKGIEAAGKTMFTRLPEYKIGRKEQVAGQGIDFIFAGYPINAYGWGGGAGCGGGGDEGAGCAHNLAIDDSAHVKSVEHITPGQIVPDYGGECTIQGTDGSTYFGQSGDSIFGQSGSGYSLGDARDSGWPDD